MAMDLDKVKRYAQDLSKNYPRSPRELLGGYVIAVGQAHIPGVFYVHQTMQAVDYVDFFSGFIKVFFFSAIIGWICCYQGFYTKGGAMGVGQFTTRAVAYSYIAVIISDVVLTKIILTIWG